MAQQVLVFVSRPYTTNTKVPWDIRQCQIQELQLSASRSHNAGSSSTTGSLAMLRDYGPLTFEIMTQIITQKNVHEGGGSSSMAAPVSSSGKWFLHEVVHGCIGTSNTFSFVIQREYGSGAEKILPGY